MNDIVDVRLKSTGVYRSKDDVQNLILRIQIKEIVEGTYENDGDVIESRSFRWQEKVFSKSEKEFYGNTGNCLTDRDKEYHRKINENIEDNHILYTYVQDDGFHIDEQHDNVYVRSCDNFHHLKQLSADLTHDENFEYMYIMGDFGEYVADTWIKAEHLLCRLKYNKERSLLLVYPDFVQNEWYILSVDNDMTKKCLYSVEILSESLHEVDQIEEEEMEDKIILQRSKMKTNKVGANFQQPPMNVLYVYLFLEILSARNFEYDNTHVRYFINLPEGWFTEDQQNLKGQTPSCIRKSDSSIFFGFPVEVMLKYNFERCDNDASAVSRFPCIYFEVISRDNWDRFRTEGLTYTQLPISQSGTHNYELQCLRIEPQSIAANLRRFFIGDAFSYNDVTWIGIPNSHEGKCINKQGVNTVGTGQLDIKLQVVRQSKLFSYNVNMKKEECVFDHFRSNPIIKNSEEVLKAYHKAKRRMIEAKERL